MIRIKSVRLGLVVSALVLAAGVLSSLYSNPSTFAANTIPGNNEVVTIGGTTDGQPINAPAYTQGYSGDGNVILFSSAATNLPNSGGSGGLYVYNIKTNTSHRADISTSGAVPNGNLASQYQLSETGRYVIFTSLATNLIDGSTRPQRDAYKHDSQTGVTTLIGSGYNGDLSQNIDRTLGVSNDGRFVLISSRYLANSYPNNYGVVVADTINGTPSWASLGNMNYQSFDDMTVGGLSCDGSFAVYQQYRSVKLADLRRGTTLTINTGSDSSTSPIISCNGRYVLYATHNRTDITPTPSGMDTYLHLVRYDRITGERQYIDSNSSGVFSNQHFGTYSGNPLSNVFNASIADTGDVVLKYNGYTYLKHLSDGSGTLESIAKTVSGSYINVANGQISKDGRYVFFSADPYDLGLAPSPSNNKIIRAKTGL